MAEHLGDSDEGHAVGEHQTGRGMAQIVKADLWQTSRFEGALKVLEQPGDEIGPPVSVYTFDEGAGAVVRDLAASGLPEDLAIADPSAVVWQPSGLTVQAPTLSSSAGPATKVRAAAQATEELSVELWLRPAVAKTYNPVRVVTFGQDSYELGFALTQGPSSDQPLEVFTGRLRTSVTPANGVPAVHSEPPVALELTHLLYTRDALGTVHLFVNGMEQSRREVGGALARWDKQWRLALANEFTTNRAWLGSYETVALYNRVLSPAEAQQHFLVGSVLTPPQ